MPLISSLLRGMVAKLSPSDTIRTIGATGTLFFIGYNEGGLQLSLRLKLLRYTSTTDGAFQAAC